MCVCRGDGIVEGVEGVSECCGMVDRMVGVLTVVVRNGVVRCRE